jgi:hypothetical protein
MRRLKPIPSAIYAASRILGIAALTLGVGLLRAGDSIETHADGGRPSTIPGGSELIVTMGKMHMPIEAAKQSGEADVDFVTASESAQTKSSVDALLGVMLTVSSTQPGDAADPSARHESAAQGSAPTEEIRKELLEARSTAWRAFFQKDLTLLEQILAPELIAIQEQTERWDNRASLLKMAQSMKERGVQLTRLEFPRTEIQLFGNTAILYYTYVMEQRLGAETAVDAGRGTEIFVHRDGKWVDVGWHLDQGAFQRKNRAWVRLGQPVPEPGSSPSPSP